MTTVSASPEAPSTRLVTLPEGAPELTLGWEVAKWAMTYLRHPNGERSGQPWRFVDSQVRFLLWWYAVNPDGSWIYRHGVRRLSKGSGKSPFAALVALAELCGPVRLKDFDPKARGGCIGKPKDMPWVQLVATAESQTVNTMRMVRAFAPKGSRVVEEFLLDPGKLIYHKLPEGQLQVRASSVVAIEGGETTFAIADETEHWTPAKGGPELMSTLRDNAAKSGARVLETSNAWVPGQSSAAEDSFNEWVLQQEGTWREEAARILYDSRMPPTDVDMADPDALREALKFAYGDCWWVPIPDVMARIWSMQLKPSEARRKYLNQPTVAEDAWVAPGQWKKLADAKVVVPDEAEVVLFFDGSKSRDATALLGCDLETGHVFTLGVWEPNPRHDSEDTVDVDDVDRVLRQAFEKYRVLVFHADVREWESFVLTEWPARYKDDLLVWAQPAARPPQAIAWDMRSHQQEFARAVEACWSEIEGQEFTHDGDSRVARHVGNAKRKAYREMVSIDKESPDSPRKIDAAVCVVGVRMLYRFVLSSKEYATRRRAGKIWGAV